MNALLVPPLLLVRCVVCLPPLVPSALPFQHHIPSMRSLPLPRRTALPLLFALLLALPLLTSPLRAQRPLRICTYNVGGFGRETSGDSLRVGALRTILSAITPDLLALQEIYNAEALTGFSDSVVHLLNPNLVSAPFFPDASSSRPDNALFYDSTLFVLLSGDTLETSGRVTPYYLVRERQSGDTLCVLVAHLQPANDRPARALAAHHIREYLRSIPLGRHVMLAGDLNLYTSSEEAYAALLDSVDPRGRLLDPIDMPGDWDGESAFAPIHTHATRADAGRMNSRFDFILLSPDLLRLSVPGSYHAFGNDGLHFNDSINRPPYAPGVTPAIAQALHDASDHLPVVMELAFTSAPAEVRTTAPASLRLMVGSGGVIAESEALGDAMSRLVLCDLKGRVVNSSLTLAKSGRAHFVLKALVSGFYIGWIECGGTRTPIEPLVILQ